MVVIKQNTGVIQGGTHSGSGKGEITRFTVKSRNEMIKTMCKFPFSWGFRQEVTFADDVMRGLSQADRGKLGAKTMNAFQVAKRRRYPAVQMMWKKEWEPRKSGELRGVLIPHYHTLVYCAGWRPADYWEFGEWVARTWVRLTKTEDQRALRVALHEKSMGLLRENDPYTEYFTKYVCKEQFGEGAGVGRFWGKLGPVVQIEGKPMVMSTEQVVRLKRVMRGVLKANQKYKKILPDGSVVVKKKKRQYEKSVRRPNFKGFVALREDSIHRLMEFLGVRGSRDPWKVERENFLEVQNYVDSSGKCV
jgi:hypothetical protein